jgi:hypothetical protein
MRVVAVYFPDWRRIGVAWAPRPIVTPPVSTIPLAKRPAFRIIPIDYAGVDDGRRDNCPVAFTLAGRVNYDVAGL